VDFFGWEKKHTLKKNAFSVGLQRFLSVCFLWVVIIFLLCNSEMEILLGLRLICPVNFLILQSFFQWHKTT